MRGLTDQERIQLGWAACSIAPEDRHTTQAEEAVGDMLKKRGLVILAPMYLLHLAIVLGM
jgi:hypothetical protein